jgi:CelD/BcsL family acetyltransferase involved in cellulose biosynthesis
MTTRQAEIETAARDDLDEISDEWEALADRLGATPFLRPGWIDAWWRAFGSGRLEFLTARRAGSLEVVLPIATRGGAARSPSNVHSPEFGLLSGDPGCAATVLDALFARRPRIVSLRFMPKREDELALLGAAARDAGYRVLVRRLERSPRVLIEGGWSAYEAGLSQNLRRDVARCRRRLEQLGRVTLDVADAPDRLSEAFALEGVGWKGRRKSAILSRSETVVFYTEAARWAAERGLLRLVFLSLDDRPIAVHIALEEGGAYFPLKGGYDPAFHAYSPGKLMIRATLERAFEIGLERYEFLGDADDYKVRWATAAYDRMLFQAFAPTVAGRVESAVFTHGRPLAKRVLSPLRR